MVYLKAQISILFLLLVFRSSIADIRIPVLFSNHMVLQQGMELPVWGWANHPGTDIHLPASPFRADNWPEISGSAAKAKKSPKAKKQPVQNAGKDELARNIANKLRQEELYSFHKDIINGTRWTYQKRYLGNPFLSEAYWPRARLVYREREYTGFHLNYDLYKDDLILLYDRDGIKKYILLSNVYLESFAYTDSTSHQERRFAYFKLPGTDQKALYEKIYDGPTLLYVRPRCEIKLEKSGIYAGEYLRSYEFYIGIEGTYQRIHSKKTLLNALKRNVPEVKKFIRRNRFKINKSHPENIVPVLRFYDSMAVLEMH